MSAQNVHFAHTSPINPPGASPQLTREQVWAGLQRKVRHANEFVPVIVDCKVVKDEDDVVVRDVKFDMGVHGQGLKEVKGEVCKSYEPCKVDFWQPDGSLICNIVSDAGEDGAQGDLYMTYTFEWPQPEIERGTDEYKKELKRYQGMARQAVDSSIATIRKMVQEGKI